MFKLIKRTHLLLIASNKWVLVILKLNFSAKNVSNSEIGIRTCSIESLSRTVT